MTEEKLLIIYNTYGVSADNTEVLQACPIIKNTNVPFSDI